METRQREGANLKQDLLGKLDGLEAKVDVVEKRSPEVVKAYREKLEAKMHELLEDNQIDDSRIAAEVILFQIRFAMMRRRYVFEATSTE